MPKVNYANANTSIPDGIHPAKLTKQELKTGPKGYYYNLEFTVDDSDPEAHGRKAWSIASISDQGLWKFKDTMLKLGANPEDLAPGSEVDTDDIVAACIGEPCRIVTKNVEYPKNDGTTGTRADIVDILSPEPMF